MNLFGNFGETPPEHEDELASLRRRLQEAETEIDRLRRALGSNHPLGYRWGGLVG